MRKPLWLLALMACLLVGAASAQDAIKVAPQAYKLEFENEWVKVTRVHYGPNEKLPEHYHAESAAAYVYLNDSGPVSFKHINLPYGNVIRKETKTGSFRLYKEVKEVHAVENLSATPSDFLRVEFKTEVVNPNSLRGKYYREDYPPSENFTKVQFENEQLRVIRLVIAPHAKMDVSTKVTEPALLVALTPTQLKTQAQKNKPAQLNLTPGKTHWLKINQSQQWENTGESSAEFLRFEFKTKPVKTQAKSSETEHKHN